MSILGYRGYIGSNMRERSVPQHVQQLVIREYCRNNGLKFLLSATEYCMPSSTMMLDAIMKEENDGIVIYSIFLLPKGRRRFPKSVHFAAESIEYSTDLNETLDLMDLYDDNRSQLPTIIAQLQQA